MRNVRVGGLDVPAQAIAVPVAKVGGEVFRHHDRGRSGQVNARTAKGR